jgi:nucleoside-diphosphate-sugar epimerase
MIFILGGRGFIGSAFARTCKRRGEQFVVLDRQNYGAYAGADCDLFINANGYSSKLLSKTDPLKDFDGSVRSVRSTLLDFRSQRYLHLSSCDVYPDCASPALTDEDLILEPARQSPYGFHKHLAELCVRHSHSDWFIFRLGGFVGPGLKKNAVFDILNGGPVWLHPDSELQFLETDRAAEIMLDVANRVETRQVFNLCGSGVIRLREIMAMVPHQVIVKPDSPLVRYEASIQKISGILQIPETRTTVQNYVQQELELRRQAAARP